MVRHRETRGTTPTPANSSRSSSSGLSTTLPASGASSFFAALYFFVVSRVHGPIPPQTLRRRHRQPLRLRRHRRSSKDVASVDRRSSFGTGHDEIPEEALLPCLPLSKCGFCCFVLNGG
ncbi:uncharacterized protein LOC106767282 [Vigna radiata var. radiata]|uniref:Uncharacterized protein LOC106767282 n=1 Tax=Vigna radiata var. radiata TaxID=3916 RepID=A0A1S3UNP3_VIGRR|nr:uncharacterized protein LOC106767282 [Vigna radiata var. radiata]